MKSKIYLQVTREILREILEETGLFLFPLLFTIVM
jgi:hypothetical protein